MNNQLTERRVQVFADPAAVARAAAEEFTRTAGAAIRAHGRCTVALAGGSTPKALYTLLASEPAFRERVPWAETHFFFGDERHAGPDDADSNYRMAREAMFERLVPDPLPQQNIHRIPAENPDAAAAAARYAADIAAFFGRGSVAPPRFDLILLGIGPDGHTASLFPGTTGLREKDTHVAAAWIDKLSTYRITLTPPVLRNAALILFLVCGKEKADVLHSVLEGPSEPDRYPSQAISASNGETLWLLDAAAAAHLKSVSS